ncbi:MAG: hypothetical protein ABI818_05380 [Acidobacteriota bacterium]
MTKSLRVPGRHGGALLLSIGAAAIALSAQSRDSLETKVTVDGNEVVFKWSKHHPWDADLVARGAALYAEYRDASDAVGTECLQAGRAGGSSAPRRGGAPGGCFTGNAVVRREDRTISFQLPDILTAEPSGSVCLVLRLPDNRVLPVRRASKRGDDTVRFQIEEWASAAAGRRRTLNLQQRRQQLDAGLTAQLAAVTQQEHANAGRGWQSDATCDAITVAPIAISGSGRPVAPPDEQDEVARQVCIARVGAGRAEDEEVSPPHDIVQYLKQVPADLRDRWLTLRGPQVERFIADWNRLGAGVERYVKEHPTPHFGAYRDRVAIQSLAYDAYDKLRQAKPSDPAPDPKWILGYLGSKVQAYERCVTDGRRQLELNYREAASLKATLEALPDRLRGQEVKSCQSGLARLAAMRAKTAALQEDLARVDREISALVSTPRPARRRNLNEVLCAL